MTKQYIDPRKQVLIRLQPEHLVALDAKIKATTGADGKPMHRSDYLYNLILKDLETNENSNTSTDGFDDLFDQSSSERAEPGKTDIERAIDALVEAAKPAADELADEVAEDPFHKHIREQAQSIENRRIYDADCAEAERLGITYSEFTRRRAGIEQAELNDEAAAVTGADAPAKDYWDQLADSFDKPVDSGANSDNESSSENDGPAEGSND